MTKASPYSFALLVWAWLMPASWAADPISLESLLNEMTDRAQRAQFPSPAYTCRQASSYDRTSVSPEDRDTWFANWDRSQFVRVEENEGRTEHVLMDAEGPGAVVRFWGTWHGPRGKDFSDGTLRFYLDGSAKPAIEGPITKVIDGGFLTEGPLSQGVSPQTPYGQRGHNLYLPIPYAKHCKITYEAKAFIDTGAKEGEALYYQINYRTYEKGALVKTFDMGQLKTAQGLLEKTLARLREGGGGEKARGADSSLQGTLAAGQRLGGEWRGPSAIQKLTVQLKAADPAQALRSTVLELTFDGESTVWSPVGDFFGVGYQLAPVRTYYTEVTDDGRMSCYWVMPFARSSQVALHNLGAAPVEAAVEIHTRSWTWNDRSLHFHATWRQLTGVHTGEGERRMEAPQGPFDVNYVQVNGRGQYLGDTLTVFNGTDAWWGEGDEKIYVDGESFPSHFGTGTEDYYGYAWCRPESFSMPFHAQPEGGGNLKGGFSVNSRFRALDSIPFQSAIKVDMELWHWRATRMNFAPGTYFYARPGVEVNVKPDPATAALPVTRHASELERRQ